MIMKNEEGVVWKRTVVSADANPAFTPKDWWNTLAIWEEATGCPKGDAVRATPKLTPKNNRLGWRVSVSHANIRQTMKVTHERENQWSESIVYWEAEIPLHPQFSLLLADI